MAWTAVDEAVRNCVATGADPDYVALLDNFCWGNPKLPDRLGGLVQASRGCHDAAVAFGAPFVSGKDSLNNEYADTDGVRHAIPGTILVHAMARVPDTDLTTTTDFKAAGNHLYVVGETLGELGGSAFLQLHGLRGGEAPRAHPDPLRTYRALFGAIQGGLVAACHDCSEGGVAVAAAEMAVGGRLGASIDLAALPRTKGLDCGQTLAFCESGGRFIVEVSPAKTSAFEAAFEGLPATKVGEVTATPSLEARGADGAALISASLSELVSAFTGS
jgi:phosphoribosylformylglycinamidine synthase